MREVFIYYRVRSAHEAVVVEAVLAYQSQLRAEHLGLRARLLRRADETASDSSSTWMEIYAIDPGQRPGGVDEPLQLQIEALAAPLAAMLDGARHTEVFIAIG